MSDPKDKLNKICTLLYKMNDYYARILIRNDYSTKEIKGLYEHRLNSSQLEVKNLFVPVFKKLKLNHELEFIKNCDLKKLSDGYFLFFYVNKNFAKNIKEKGYHFAYQQLICDFDGEFDGNICKDFNEKFKSIS
jgi:hypothetical protein